MQRAISYITSKGAWYIPSALAGAVMALLAWTVTVRVCNVSDASSTPTAEAYNVRVEE